MERFSPELKDTQPFSTSIDNDKLHQEGNHLKNIKAFFPETVRFCLNKYAINL